MKPKKFQKIHNYLRGIGASCWFEIRKEGDIELRDILRREY